MSRRPESTTQRALSVPGAIAWGAAVVAAIALHVESTGGGGDAIGGVLRALSGFAAVGVWLVSVPLAFFVWRGPRRGLVGAGLVVASALPSAGMLLSEQLHQRAFERNPVRLHSLQISSLCSSLDSRQATGPALREGWQALGRLRAEAGAPLEADESWLRQCAQRGGPDMVALLEELLGAPPRDGG